MHTPQPQRPLKSYEWVMIDLKKQIDEGTLKAGDKLPSVVDLAAQYSVGRSTIREALSALKAMGHLDIRQGGGTFVKQPPISEEQEPMHPAFFHLDDWKMRAESLRHVLEVRRMLEAGCAMFAARHRTDEDLAQLEQTLEEMQLNLHDETFSEQADVRFHQQIAAATHNPILIELSGSLTDRLHESMRDTRALWFYAERSSAERLLQEHQSIYEAIAERDEALAASRMEKHIVKVEQVLHERSQ